MAGIKRKTEEQEGGEESNLEKVKMYVGSYVGSQGKKNGFGWWGHICYDKYRQLRCSFRRILTLLILRVTGLGV